jgi:Ca2+-transporting ATPase
MDKPPRPPSEPIINRQMMLGIGVQTVAITTITLLAYWIGLKTHPEASEYAETMAFVSLSFSELLRAFTARSENYPILKIGIFTNQSMNWAVISSMVLLIAVVYIPFLNQIFNTVPLGLAQWQYVLPLLLVPAIAAEITKWFISRRTTPSAA